MANAYFSRIVPFYFIAPEDLGDSQGFDAYPVEVNEDILTFATRARALVAAMENKFETSPAPEEAAQEEALFATDLIEQLINGN